MTEKVRLLEVDINLEGLIKKGADAKGSIEVLKEEIKAYKKDLKESEQASNLMKNVLENLEKAGKQNTLQYRSQKKELDQLTKSQDQVRQKLELTEANLRKEQKQYRLTKSGIDSYNKTVVRSEGFITKTDGSITQLSHAVSENKKIYRGLSQEMRENEKVGGKLLKLIQAQDEEYKELQTSIGTTQVHVGDYKGQIRELLNENVNLSVAFKRQIEQIPVIGQFLGGAYSFLVKFAAGQKASAKSTSLNSKALRRFKIALASTGIGIIVIALGALIAYLNSTQKGINKVNKVLTPLKIVFQSLLGVLQKVGEDMFKAFENPQESIKALWQSIKTNLVNRVTAVGGVFKALGKIISSGFTDGYKDLANSSLQAVTGVEDVIGKTKGLANQTGKFFDEAYSRGLKIEELQQQLSAGEADFITQTSKLKEDFKAQNKIAEDQTKTLAEREAAAKRSINIQKEINQLEDNRLLTQIDILKLKQQSNDTSDAERAELAKLEAKRNESRTRQLEAETTQQNKFNSIRKEANNKAIAARKKAVDEAIKESKTLLDIYIAEQGVKSKTLAEELKLAEEISIKKKEILKQELKAKKITQSEYNLAVLELDNDLLSKRAEIAVDNASRELKIFKDTHQAKLDANTFFTEELLRQEIERLDLIAEKEREYHQKRLEEGVINQQEYNDAINTVNEENRIAQEELQLEREEAKREQEIVDLDNQRLIDEENFLTEFEIQSQRLEVQRLQELAAAKKSGADIEKINKKFALRQKKLEEETKLSQIQNTQNAISQIGGLLKGFFGESKGLNVALATADAIIGVQKAYLSQLITGDPTSLPRAIGAGVQAGVFGAANVAKVAGVKFQEGGYLYGNSHEQGGIPFTIGGQPGFEAEGGEFIINKRATSMFRPLLESINSKYNVGKLAPSNLYTNGGIVTSNIQRVQSQQFQGQNIDSNVLKDAVYQGSKDGIAEANIMVTVEDINTGQGNYAEVVNGANL